jgi:EAL domain-containing protein (putative c-di-GMP-specific phosphodiesterase class I)
MSNRCVTEESHVMERLALEVVLRQGLTSGALYCVHQPQIDVITGGLFALESLVRWDHPIRGTIPPDQFIPIAEATDLIDTLLDQVLDMTLAAQRFWIGKLGFCPAVAVKVSPGQLTSTRLFHLVMDALERWNTPADKLWLEVTESAAARVDDLSVLNDLKTLGVKLAVDDFGTGASTLSRLGELEWDVLKIDQSFVHHLSSDPTTQHVVRAMVAMAHALGMLTVAKGVATHAQLDLLRAAGCDIAQGSLLAPPVRARTAVDGVNRDGHFGRGRAISL